MAGQEKRILCVGLACVDIVNMCENYATEDYLQSILEQIWTRGGNAGNNCTVLKQLGQPEVEYMGTLAHSNNSPFTGFLLEDIKSCGIITENCVFIENGICPVSIVIINQQNGSRTIFHQLNLPELTYGNFLSAKLDFTKYKWIQFEDRPNSAAEIRQMMQHVHAYNSKVGEEDYVVTSVEVEKPLPGAEILYDMADYVFVGKDHAQFKGFNNKEDACRGLVEFCRPGSTLICPWGEDGAIARTTAGQVFKSPAYPPDKMVDSLGAGDTFFASFICATSKGINLQQALTLACKIAGAKCGLKGYSSIKNISETSVLLN